MKGGGVHHVHLLQLRHKACPRPKNTRRQLVSCLHLHDFAQDVIYVVDKKIVEGITASLEEVKVRAGVVPKHCVNLFHSPDGTRRHVSRNVLIGGIEAPLEAAEEGQSRRLCGVVARRCGNRRVAHRLLHAHRLPVRQGLLDKILMRIRGGSDPHGIHTLVAQRIRCIAAALRGESCGELASTAFVQVHHPRELRLGVRSNCLGANAAHATEAHASQAQWLHPLRERHGPNATTPDNQLLVAAATLWLGT
mmetsp:Transcript_15579/g.59193  ORF Transcript_15579/g.59193 Transcript_15579/m.59193 type:complete len:250 (-) Transcript_15579:62-811(-)